MINNFINCFRVILLLLPIASVATEYQYEEDPVDDGSIVEMDDFKAVLKLVKSQNKPLLLEFSTAWCSYCEALEEEVLKPMLSNKAYTEKIIIRKLEVDDVSIINAQGKSQTAVDFAIEHNVDIYPTVIFFNGEGKEIAQRIIGITTFDYIAYIMDQAIEDARRQM